VNPLGDNKDTIKKNIQILIDASTGAGLEVNPRKTKFTRCNNLIPEMAL
jgi:hypothetical protein